MSKTNPGSLTTGEKVIAGGAVAILAIIFIVPKVQPSNVNTMTATAQQESSTQDDIPKMWEIEGYFECVLKAPTNYST